MCGVLSPSVPLWAPLLSDIHPPGPVVASAEVLLLTGLHTKMDTG